MKKLMLSLALATLVSEPVFAQSSVTLYGLLSTSIMYSNNQGGHSAWQMSSGPQQANRWGVKGTEDLGGGMRAVFVLENGFSSTSGSLGQGGRMFGRQAYVGIASDRFGTVTLGRQYDLASMGLGPYESGWQFAGSSTHIGDNDNVFNDFRLNNSIEYQSVDFRGLKFAGLYGFSNKPDGFSDNSGFSGDVTYKNGPISLGVAYLQVNNPNDPNNTGGTVSGDYGYSSPFITNPATNAGVRRQRIFGSGGGYQFGTAFASLLYTNSQFTYLDSSRLTLQNFEVSAYDYVRPNLQLGIAYTLTIGQYHPQDTAPKWHQVSAAVDYFLTKRTDLFVVGTYERAAGDATFSQIYSLSPSSGKTQVMVEAGIRHKF